MTPTHLVANTAGVGDPTGQRPRAVAVVVLVHAPVFVLVAAAAGELRETDETLATRKQEVDACPSVSAAVLPSAARSPGCS